jgi:GNAT superfamily N-acetyltransferase
MTELRFERLHGAEIKSQLGAIADLRMQVFRDWPYLYEGDLETERDYLQIYLDSERSFALLAFDGDELVGMATAMPLRDEDPRIQQPFHDADFDAATIFYFPEAILLPGYRGRGLYRRFFHEREAHARSFTGYEWAALCTVERPADHPARPASYQPLDPIWERFGFDHRPDLKTSFDWLDVGDQQETTKPLVFWLKPFTRQPVTLESTEVSS